MTRPEGDWFSRSGLALLTDFYELTMMAGYLKEGLAEREVVFEYFFRTMPPDRGFAVAAGLKPFLDYVTNLRFTEDDLAYLKTLGVFDAEFLDYLGSFRPRCTIRAVPEGTLVFPHVPLVQIEGTLFEAQLIETALLNMLNYQTLIATKAARICLATDGDPIMEFGLRRAHGPDGGVSGSRAAYIGGCASTSNVVAGKVYGIPVSGTHAHSWVMSFPSELEAFRAFARNFPKCCTLLVDTYDTIESGVPNAIRVFKEMAADGIKVRPAIRLDSGDLAKLSKQAYKLLREAGYDDPLIVASNDLEEDIIADLKRQGAKINAWGVGTHLITSRDYPSLGGVYKLMAVKEAGQWSPRIKLAANLAKATDPGKKVPVRYYDDAGAPLGDVLYLHDEDWPRTGNIPARDRVQTNRRVRIQDAARGEALLETVFESGQPLAEAPDIASIRDYAQRQIAALPDEFKRLRNPEIYTVVSSDSLASLREQMLQNPEQAG
jgi:nicotinate phosphoribosyltransferase